MTVTNVFGVDFSGAKLAGENTWIAHASIDNGRLNLESLRNLATLAGAAERSLAMTHLVELVRESRDAVWGFDFPFGLPIELFPDDAPWAEQFEFLKAFGDDAKVFGRECVRIAQTRGDSMHIRRATDREAKTPFDCYHYRIIYQTFFGMRLVLDPLRQIAKTAVLPFPTTRLEMASRCIVETCPSSTLKRLNLPPRLYKQATGGPLSTQAKRTRHQILDGLGPFISIPDSFRRIAMRNPGGDALDAIIAAVGTWQGFQSADHAGIATHARYPREGYLYV